MLALCYLVKLIEVDKGEGGETEVQVALVLEVDAVVVIVAQFLGQQYSAER